MGRQREPQISLVLYHLFKWSVVSPLLYTCFRGRVYGTEHVPRTGPLVIVSNHASHFDPPLLSCAVERPVAYMAKEELFDVPLLGKAIQWYGAYPVKRGSADRSAIRAALSKIEDNWAVGIFPSGTRTEDARIHEPKLGAAMIAAKRQVPLLPVSLWGTEKILLKGSSLPHSAPVTIRIGKPIEPPQAGDRQDLQRVTQECIDAIHALHDLGR